MNRPLVGVALAFLLGLAAASHGEIRGDLLLEGTGLLLVLTGILLGRRAAASGYVLLLAVFGGGAFRYTWALQGQRGEGLRPFLNTDSCVAGVVVEEPRRQDERWQVALEARMIRWLPARGEAGREPSSSPEYAVQGRVYLVAADLSQVAVGDWLCARGCLRALPGATNPGQFSFRRHLAQRHLQAYLFPTPGSPLHHCEGNRGAWLPTWTIRARKALTGAVARYMPGPHAELMAQLLNSIVYGLVAAPLPRNLEEHFRRAGVIHILVASGTQVSLLIVFLILLRRPSLSSGLRSLLAFWGKLAPRGARWPTALASLGQPPLGRPRIGCFYSLWVLLVLLGYTGIAGAEASISRAALMGSLLLLARGTERDFDVLTALAAAALVLLVTHPFDLFSPSFQLSFAAVLGLTLLSPSLYRRLALFLPRLVALPLALSCAAQLAVAPILAYEFHQVSWAGFLANIPVVPAAGALVVTGLLTSLLGLFSGPLATWLNGFNHALLHLIMRTTFFFSELPGSSMHIPAFSWMHLALAYGILALLALGLQGKITWRRERGIVYGLLLLTGLVLWQVNRSLNTTLQVTFLDVGNGDAILIQAPSGRTMLIDGGPYRAGPPEYDTGERVVVPALMALGVQRLDVVVATHLQADHIGGLPAVLRAVPVGYLLLSDTGEDTAAADRLRYVAQKHRVKIIPARRGQKINLGRGIRAFVLWPTAAPLTDTGSDSNNNAVVLKLVYGRVSFLFTSDIGAAAEGELLRSTGYLTSTILKVAHHGSDRSTTPEFLREVRPRIAVISVGTAPERGVAPRDRINAHGHPARLLQQRLAQAGVRLYRTDLDGAITMRTNGRSLRVQTYGER